MSSYLRGVVWAFFHFFSIDFMRKIQETSLYGFVLCVALFCCSVSYAMAGEKGDSIRILFLGNSYTHYHNLPGMVQQIGANVARDYRMKIACKNVRLLNIGAVRAER